MQMVYKVFKFIHVMGVVGVDKWHPLYGNKNPGIEGITYAGRIPMISSDYWFLGFTVQPHQLGGPTDAMQFAERECVKLFSYLSTFPRVSLLKRISRL